jgi:hypothetical protein
LVSVLSYDAIINVGKGVIVNLVVSVKEWENICVIHENTNCTFKRIELSLYKMVLFNHVAIAMVYINSTVIFLRNGINLGD